MTLLGSLVCSRRKHPLLTLLAVFVLSGMMLSGRSAWAAEYTVTDLGTLGGTGSHAFGLNALGTVVGNSLTAGNPPQLAFRHENGVMMSLGTLPDGATSTAIAINDDGTIVGYASFPSLGIVFKGFVFRNGVMEPIATLGGFNSPAYAINNSGWIVGSADLESGVARAFLLRDGMMTNLGTLGGDFSAAYNLNDSGVVVGEAANEAGINRAFRFDGTMIDLGTLGGNFSSAYGINAAGLIVGSASTTAGPRHAFRYDGTMHDLGTLGGPTSGANSVNASGVIVGASTKASDNESYAFIYDGSMRDLNSLILSESGWLLISATGINDLGQICGYGRINGQLRAFLLTPNVGPTLTVTYSVNPDGTIAISSDGYLSEAPSLAGPFIALGVKTLTVNPATTSGNRFYLAGEQ